MTNKEIDELLPEMKLILNDPSALESHGIKYAELCSIPQCASMILLFYYWGLYEPDIKLLKTAFNHASNENFEYINKKISKMWLTKANREIRNVIKEIENSTDT